MTSDIAFEYNDQFYDVHTPLAIASAHEIIPIIIKLLHPKSIIDIGCGVGAWLSVWEKFGVNDFIGVDGDYIKLDCLLFERNKFIPYNLESGFKYNRKFDVVTCLEVAEHLSRDSANNFVESLCSLGNIILFSAAIPGQEGTHHINEQYPSYWQKLFKENHFVLIDCIRKKIWTNEKVTWWYRQNILMYVHQDYLFKSDLLKSYAVSTDECFLDLVHPEYFNYKTQKANYYESLWIKAKNENNNPICIFYLKVKRKLRSYLNYHNP